MQRQQYFDREGKESKQKGNSSGSGSSLQAALETNTYSAPALVLIIWCNKLFQLTRNRRKQIQQRIFTVGL